MKWYVSFNDGPYYEDDKAGYCFHSILRDALAAGLEDLILFMWCPSDHAHCARNASYRIYENGIQGPVLPFSSVDRMNQSV